MEVLVRWIVKEIPRLRQLSSAAGTQCAHVVLEDAVTGPRFFVDLGWINRRYNIISILQRVRVCVFLFLSCTYKGYLVVP